MKKFLLTSILVLVAAIVFAQDEKSVKVETGSTDVKELQVARDSTKSQLRAITLQNNKDNNHFDKLQSDKVRLKDQLKAAKKAKKTDKIDELQAKITQNGIDIKDLDAKLKANEKEMSRLEKQLKNDEKALKDAKDKAAKEKADNAKAAKAKSKK